MEYLLKRLEKSRVKIQDFDLILTGTISKRYDQCGKQQCRCKKDKKYWHGPYYIWTRKVAGKTVTRSLSKKQVDTCKRAINNMKKLKALLEKWQQESANIVEKLNDG